MFKNVFLSYSRKNITFAQELESKLAQAGLQTWVDWRDIPPGVPWRDRIYEALIQSDAMVICLSPDYLQSEMCRTELYLARSYRKQLIPVMLVDCLNMLTTYAESKGLEDLFIVDYAFKTCIGLPVSDEVRLNQILAALNPVPESDPMHPGLFYISYASQDAEFATQLARDLSASHSKVWIATLSYVAGDNCREIMYDAMMGASGLIVCLSPEAARSPSVRREVLLARTRRIPILPVLTERIAADDSLVGTLAAELNQSYEMRLVGEINWMFPRPDYNKLLRDLNEALQLSA